MTKLASLVPEPVAAAIINLGYDSPDSITDAITSKEELDEWVELTLEQVEMPMKHPPNKRRVSPWGGKLKQLWATLCKEAPSKVQQELYNLKVGQGPGNGDTEPKAEQIQEAMPNTPGDHDPNNGPGYTGSHQGNLGGSEQNQEQQGIPEIQDHTIGDDTLDEEIDNPPLPPRETPQV
jgi:hypothetical protein